VDGNRVGHVIGGRWPASAENVAYHAYSAGHEQTARQVRRHRPSCQGRRPFPRPGGLRGRSQPIKVNMYSDLVRSSRLGLACENEVWLERCPRVKRL
jgi:hypothetical protein